MSCDCNKFNTYYAVYRIYINGRNSYAQYLRKKVDSKKAAKKYIAQEISDKGGQYTYQKEYE